MNISTNESANEGVQPFPEAEDSDNHTRLPHQSGETAQPSAPCWSDFLARLKHYCCARNWQLVYDSPDDLACMIFAYADPGTNDTSKAGEVLPADLPF